MSPAPRHAKASNRSTAVVRQSALSGAAATVAVGTGLVLDVVTAAVFGAGADTDAFVVAARVPLALMAIFMVLGNQVLVPTYATWQTQLPPERNRRLTTTVLLSALLGGAAVAALLALTADLLLLALAPGFDDAQRELSASMLRVMVLTIPLTAGSEVLRAWLNARHMFVVPALMTVVLNVTAAAIILAIRGDVEVIPFAYLAGSAAQFAFMLVVAVTRGLRPATPAFGDGESSGLLRLMTRPTLAAGLNPLARVVETTVASLLPAGSVTILHYGNRLVSAVGGTVLFRSIMVAVLPRLTRAYAADEREEAGRLTVLALRLMLVVSLPLTAVGCVLAVPASVAVFGVGRFSEDDARMLGLLLAVLCLSLAPSAVQRALLAPFYAVRDTKVPLRNTVYGVLANWAFLPVFLLPLWGTGYEVLGMGAAYSAAQLVHVGHAWRRLRLGGLESSYEQLRGRWRLALSAVVAGAAAAAVQVGASALAGSRAPQPWEVAAVVTAGVVGMCCGLAVELSTPASRRALRRSRKLAATSAR
jgi:murein biosynthesis integral membrane protein MurJ